MEETSYFMFMSFDANIPTEIYFVEYNKDNLLLFEKLKFLKCKLYDKKLDEKYVNTFIDMPIVNTISYKLNGKLDSKLINDIVSSSQSNRVYNVDVCDECWQNNNDQYGTRKYSFVSWLKDKGLTVESHSCALLCCQNRDIIVD